jgi:ABC-type multidrug transport system permease subunit
MGRPFWVSASNGVVAESWIELAHGEGDLVTAGAADRHRHRFRTLPMAKSAVITGHLIADLARGLLGLAVTIAAGNAVGFRPSAGIGGWAAAVAVFLLVTLALSLLATLIGLLGKNVEVAQQLAAIIIIPVFFSSALVPAGTMPPWLRVVTANQPMT